MLNVVQRWIILAITSILPLPILAAPQVSVTFINPGGSTSFWGEVAETMMAAAEDLDIKLKVIHTDRDRFKKLEVASQLAAQSEHPDYFIIVNELQQAPALMDALRSTNVPIFELLNRLTLEQRERFALAGGDQSRLVGSIVPDNEIAGYEMANSLITQARELSLDEHGVQMLALLGDAATPAALAREAGLMRALGENPDVELVRAFPVQWDIETAYERTVAVLRRYELDAVWSANDQIALGAMLAAREHGTVPGQDTVFVGLNWSEEGLTAVNNGEMTLTHGGHFFAGAWSMVMIRDLADGLLAEGTHVEFPMTAITQDRAKEFCDAFDDRDWRAIDFRSFSLKNAPSGAYEFTADAILKAARAHNPGG